MANHDFDRTDVELMEPTERVEHALETLRRHRRDLEERGTSSPNVSLLYDFVIGKLQNDLEVQEQLAKGLAVIDRLSERVAQLEALPTLDTGELARVKSDAEEARQAAQEAKHIALRTKVRVDILAATVGALFDELSRVTSAAERQAKALAEQKSTR